jgi:hypothetical protein
MAEVAIRKRAPRSELRRDFAKDFSSSAVAGAEVGDSVMFQFLFE